MAGVSLGRLSDRRVDKDMETGNSGWICGGAHQGRVPLPQGGQGAPGLPGSGLDALGSFLLRAVCRR